MDRDGRSAGGRAPRRLYTADDLSTAELHAARLDGDVYAVGEAWASLAEPDVPALRAAALSAILTGRRVVVDRRSAAWVWGALSRAPVRPTLALRSSARIAGVNLRETPIPAHDVVRLGTVSVATPPRTVIDLLRAPGPADLADATAVRWLLTHGSVSVEGVRERLTATGHLPHGRHALRKLDLLSPR